MSDSLSIVVLSALVLFWGYLFIRGLKRKEFRRRGYWGWFRKEADPIDFWMYVLLCFVELAACAYVVLLIVSRK